jgi:hypothetical protein
LLRHRWGVLFWRVSTNSMVTTAVEKEFKGSIQIRQMEHIGNYELRLNPGCMSAFVRALNCQWSQVYANYIKTLLSQPNTIGSSPTT